METVATVHRNLGELAVMSRKTQETEKRILARALSLLAAERTKMDKAMPAAKAGDREAATQYSESVKEIGRLQQVVAKARKALDE